MAGMAKMVIEAVVQEAVSRGVSFVLGKRKDKASQGQYLERLRKAVKEVEFMLERTAKLPMTEVSLLRERIELKRDFIEAACLLRSRSKKRQSPQGQGQISQSQVVTHSSSTRSVSSFIGIVTKKEDHQLFLSCDDVQRFEQFADSAQNILKRVESGCSLRRYMFFPCPLVRHLFAERKTLIYRMVQAEQERFLCVWPTCFEERGVEALALYMYTDHKRPHESFLIQFLLRLSESTDIVGVAMNCLQSLASQFKIVADSAIGELTLLANLLQDVSKSDAPPWVGIQEWHSEISQMFRPDPLCCKANWHVPHPNNIVTSSELSHVFSEEVIVFHFGCYISTPEYSLRSTADEAGKRSIMRNMMPSLKMSVSLAPHMVHDERLQASYAAEMIGDNDEERLDFSIQQVTEMVRSRAISCFLRQPKIAAYYTGWFTKHGVVGFLVKKAKSRCAHNQWQNRIHKKYKGKVW